MLIGGSGSCDEVASAMIAALVCFGFGIVTTIAALSGNCSRIAGTASTHAGVISTPHAASIRNTPPRARFEILIFMTGSLTGVRSVKSG